jgi:sugar lactone lactonase YvrE
MIFDNRGNLYLGDLENNAIMCRTPEGELKTFVQGPQIKWPDTFTIDEQENFYFTTSRIHEMEGDISELDFNIFKVPLT